MPGPAAEQLQEAVREQLSVEHGRIDLEGQPAAAYVPVIRAGALLEHRATVEELLVEAAEVLLHGGSR